MANQTKEALKQLLESLKQIQESKDNSQDRTTEALVNSIKQELGKNDNYILNILRSIAGEIPVNRIRNGKYKGRDAESIEAASERLNDRLEDLTGFVQLTSDYDNNLIDFLIELIKRVKRMENSGGQGSFDGLKDVELVGNKLKFKKTDDSTKEINLPSGSGGVNFVGVTDVDRVGDVIKITRSDNTSDNVDLSDLKNEVAVKDVNIVGGKLKVTKTDNTSQDINLPNNQGGGQNFVGLTDLSKANDKLLYSKSDGGTGEIDLSSYKNPNSVMEVTFSNNKFKFKKLDNSFEEISLPEDNYEALTAQEIEDLFN